MVSDVTVTYYGACALHISDGITSLLVDGFFSRPSFLEVACGRLAPNQRALNHWLTRSNLRSVDALFVSHSHYDHALDSPWLAQHFDAPLYGSQSTLNLGRGAGLSNTKLQQITAGSLIHVGAFTVRAFHTPHSPGDAFPGTIDRELSFPVRASKLRTGECFSFHLRHPQGSLLVVPSANFTAGTLEGIDAEAVYLGIGKLGRQSDDFRRRYWRETVEMCNARLVIPIHWDNFGRSLQRPLRPIPRPFDDVPRAWRFLAEAARNSSVKLRWQNSFETIRPFAGDRLEGT